MDTVIAGGDIPFIIVILIIIGIGKLIGAAMRAMGSGQQSAKPRPGSPAGEDQVRKFLEQVTGVSLEPQPQPKPRRQRRTKPKPQEEPAPEPVVQPRPALHTLATRPTRPRGAFRFNADRLRDPQDLRDAIVLREVLGKPLALRRRTRRAIPVR